MPPVDDHASGDVGAFGDAGDQAGGVAYTDAVGAAAAVAPSDSDVTISLITTMSNIIHKVINTTKIIIININTSILSSARLGPVALSNALALASCSTERLGHNIGYPICNPASDKRLKLKRDITPPIGLRPLLFNH